MLVESFNRYDASFRILSKEDNSPAGKINKDVVIGDWDEDETLLKFARGCDVITLENEFINHERIKFLEALNIPVAPTSEVVRLIQDKYTQKKTLKNLGIPVAGFSPVNNTDDIKNLRRINLIRLYLNHGRWDMTVKAMLKLIHRQRLSLHSKHFLTGETFSSKSLSLS